MRRHANRTARHFHSQSRNGTTVAETLVAGILLATVFSLIGPVLLRANQARAVASQRQLATQIASNCLERLAAGEPQKTVAGQSTQGWDYQKWLPGLTVTLTVRDDDGLRRATVAVDWTTPIGGLSRPVRLTRWLRKPREPQP
jgi:Tfp pilus assembly protein PilV